MATATKSRKSAKSASRSGFRAIWRGQIAIRTGVVQVQAINAEIKENAEVHFHLLHRPDQGSISPRCAQSMAKCRPTRSLKGTNSPRGNTWSLTNRKSTSCATNRERALSIDAFISPDELDPLYFDGRMYYLMPSGVGAESLMRCSKRRCERKKRAGHRPGCLFRPRTIGRRPTTRRRADDGDAQLRRRNS